MRGYSDRATQSDRLTLCDRNHGSPIETSRSGSESCVRTLQLAANGNATDRILKILTLIDSGSYLPINLSELSRDLHIERTYCSKLFRQVTGESFSNWIRRARIQRACVLLDEEPLSVTQISEAVGYADITTFERNFRREIGFSPREFRKSVRQPR